MSKAPLIYYVEDDEHIRDLTAYALHQAGMEVRAFHDGDGLVERCAVEPPDAVLLDIMLPGDDGLVLLQALRGNAATENLPVMMLTAKAEKDDRITGFNAGADDYLPKPFAPDELICRVRAMLRRSGEYRPTVLTFGDAALDCSTGMLSCAGQSVRLSGREFQVMELFLRAPKVVLSAERILERVWGWDSDAEINVVWVHISNLRKKLKGIGSCVTIRANRGLGYVLESSHD